jgi:hypothetical protein
LKPSRGSQAIGLQLKKCSLVICCIYIVVFIAYAALNTALLLLHVCRYSLLLNQWIFTI